MATYNLYEDSLQHEFMQSRAKIQLFGGGYANGKTAALCIKFLKIAINYPGCNLLLARSTLPKLNDTLRKEFIKWCPKEWIKTFPKPARESSTCTLKNGSMINFRYVAQQGKSGPETVSNLLSATYDAIGIDQIEDPEISHKDFLDLLGRLRGSAKYDPQDEWDDTMPLSGPRWFIITCNPTRNWVYRKLVKPLHDYNRTGKKHKELMLDKTTGEPIMEIFEGSTYTNKDNLAADFIETLETSYTGQMKERFLHGKWGAYEGLVFPTYDYELHTLRHEDMVDYYWKCLENGVRLNIIEGFDYGIAVHSSYLLGFVDHRGNICELDGFYHNDQTQLGVEYLAGRIKKIRAKYGLAHEEVNMRPVHADPSIFRRAGGGKKEVGPTVADLFADEGIIMIRGNNNPLTNITKIQGYLKIHPNHEHPIGHYFGAPYLYISDNLDFLDSEMTDYYWKKDTSGDQEDTPIDKDDHAINALEYQLTSRPNVAKVADQSKETGSWMFAWQEQEIAKQQRSLPRHA